MRHGVQLSLIRRRLEPLSHWPRGQMATEPDTLNPWVCNGTSRFSPFGEFSRRLRSSFRIASLAPSSSVRGNPMAITFQGEDASPERPIAREVAIVIVD